MKGCISSVVLYILMISASLAIAADQQGRCFSASPASFVENAGQIEDPSINYAFYGSGAAIFHTISGPVLTISKQPRAAATYSSCTFSANFPGSKSVRPVGRDALAGRMNYYGGTNHRNWHNNLQMYAVVEYPELYEGIDLYTWGTRFYLKYEFHVAPGADHTKIRIRFTGIEKLFIDEAGNLQLKTALGTLIDSAPYIYQMIDGQKIEVKGRYRLLDDTSYCFEIDGEIDPQRELIIDPELSWTAALGGTGISRATGIASDANGDVVVVGNTGAPDFAGISGYSGDNFIFVSKISSQGNLLWTTLLTDGSAGRVAVDPDGAIIVVGTTESVDFPITEGFGPINGGIDACISKFSSDGKLLWSRYLGGSQGDSAKDVAVDAEGNTYITGGTASADFPSLRSAYSEFKGSSDTYIVKVSPQGQLLWSRIFGGGDDDSGAGVIVSKEGKVFVTGSTTSADFPMLNSFDDSYNGEDDAFVIQLTPNGDLLFSTYLGGSKSESGIDIAADQQGNVYVTGSTTSDDFPTPDGFDKVLDINHYMPLAPVDAFVTKIGEDGELRWSSYLGGIGTDTAYAVTVDSAGNPIVTGSNHAADFPTDGGFDRRYDGITDSFVTKITADGHILWSSYLGNSETDTARDLAVGPNGSIYVSGDGEIYENGGYSQFPISDGMDWTGTTMFNIFVARIDSDHLFSVRSSPFQGIHISGSKAGDTVYTAECQTGEDINIEAPLFVYSSSGLKYAFNYWILDGTNQPTGQINLQLKVVADHTAVAVYQKAQWTLTVDSSPISGAGVFGDFMEMTPFTAIYEDKKEATCFAVDDSLFVGGLTYDFIWWEVDGVPRAARQRKLTLSMTADHNAKAVYSLYGDVNGDCKVNIIDFICIRNRLGKDVDTNTNWRYDLNEDGRINILDLIRIRNRLGEHCPE